MDIFFATPLIDREMAAKRMYDPCRYNYLNVINAKRQKDLGYPDVIVTVVFVQLDGKKHALSQRSARVSFISLNFDELPQIALTIHKYFLNIFF